MDINKVIDTFPEPFKTVVKRRRNCQIMENNTVDWRFLVYI